MHDHSYLHFRADLTSPVAVAAYDEAPLWSAMFGLLLLEHVPLAGITTALDVGCGTGFPLIELAERLGPASRVHGIDPWSAALDRARAKIAVRGTPNVTLHEGSGAAMPFPGASFDLVVSNLGVNNFEDAAAVARECRRVCRDGATFALTTNLRGHMRELYDVYAEVLAGDEAALGRLRAHVAHRATIEGTRALLAEAGFTVSRVVERSAPMRFAGGTALLNHFFIKLGFLDAWKGVAAGNADEVFERVQKRLDAMGELSLTIPMAYVEATAS